MFGIRLEDMFGRFIERCLEYWRLPRDLERTEDSFTEDLGGERKSNRLKKFICVRTYCKPTLIESSCKETVHLF